MASLAEVFRGGLGVALMVSACGGSTENPGGAADAAAGGSAGSGASPAGGGSGGSGAVGGTGGSAATGGYAGTAGTGALGGGGTGGTVACSGLDYCACSAATHCTAYVEECFCPCDEPCKEPCDCACGGGAYLGCGADFGPFGAEVMGTWLIGWSGGLNHFSWVRLEPSGVARFLDGATLSANLPYWECNGEGSWMLTAKLDTVGLTLPTSCGGAFEPLTFDILPHSGYPTGAVLAASVEAAQPISGYKFPHGQCDAPFTSCQDPL